MARRNKAEMAAARELETRIVSVLQHHHPKARQAVGKALALLLARQTTDEKTSRETKHTNQRGFNQPDAWKGQQHAEHFQRNGELTDWMFNYWTLSRIYRTNPDMTRTLVAFGEPKSHLAKYRGQLAEEAQIKQEKAAQAV